MFEYKILKAEERVDYYTPDENGCPLRYWLYLEISDLDREAEEGWEVVSCAFSEDGDIITAVLKRKKDD
jgi:hypothetical protein